MSAKLTRALAAMSGATRADFAALALAAADQAGASVEAQAKIAALLLITPTRPQAITGESITDEQIRELQHELLYPGAGVIRDSYAVDDTDRALGRQGRYETPDVARRPGPDTIRDARARCAAILNARAATTDGEDGSDWAGRDCAEDFAE